MLNKVSVCNSRIESVAKQYFQPCSLCIWALIMSLSFAVLPVREHISILQCVIMVREFEINEATLPVHVLDTKS